MAHPAAPAPAAPRSSAPSRLAALRCLGALILLEASGTIINATIYASMADFFAIGREIATLANAGAFVLLAVVALRRPALLNARVLTAGASIAITAGVICLGVGIVANNSLLTLAGLLCRAAASTWLTSMFTIALSTLPTSRSVLLVAGGGAILSSAGCALIPIGWPTGAACAILALCILASLALVWRLAKPPLASIRQSGASALQDLKGFAPFAPLLLCVFLIATASGYAIAFNQQNNAPLVTLASDVIVAVAFAMVVIDKSQKSEDRLFSLSVLLVVAGYLVAPYEIASAEGTTNSLLGAGRDCFYLLLWILLAFTGRRNLFMLLPMVGFVRAASSLGTDAGAMVGHATNQLTASNPQMAAVFASIMVFCFVAFLWLGFRHFSFTEAVSEVRLVTPPEIEQIGSHIDGACRLLGKQHGLTPRETEILILLARGRDGKFIAEKYVLSYQTVKTHIKHLYAKLGVHSRQELINLTDQTIASAASQRRVE